MSRAFTKEGDGDAEEDLAPRPISSLPNYVTPDGLKALEERVHQLDARRIAAMGKGDRVRDRKRKEIQRELRYYESRVESAKMIDPAGLDHDEARIGATIEVEDGSGKKSAYRIVGEDQADGKGLICWASPLAAVLLGAKAGDSREWDRGGTPVTLRVLTIRY